MSRRERWMAAICIGTVILWQLGVAAWSWQAAAAMTQLFDGATEPLPFVTTAFLATYKAWAVIPVAFASLLLWLFLRPEMSFRSAVALLLSSLICTSLLAAWAVHAMFRPLFSFLESLN